MSLRYFHSFWQSVLLRCISIFTHTEVNMYLTGQHQDGRIVRVTLIYKVAELKSFAVKYRKLSLTPRLVFNCSSAHNI